MTPEELEKFIHQNLRALPSRRAPRSLEARVVAALERQALIPWYHRSWSHWPAAVRSAFLVVALGASAAVLAAFYLAYNGVDTGAVAARAGERFAVVTQLYHGARWIVDYAAQVAGRIPSLWIYGTIAIVAALYATFFGLGAAAYRTLYRNH